MTTAATPAASRSGCLRGITVILSALFALCTIFAAVVTTVQAINERNQQSWPQTTAHVTSCKLSRSSTRGGHRQYINCRLSYTAGSQLLTANVYSRYVPGPEVAQYPPNQLAPYAAWVEAHPAGSQVSISYNPASPTKIATPDEPLLSAGRHTPQNVKLLAGFASAFVVVSAFAWLTRPRPALAA